MPDIACYAGRLVQLDTLDLATGISKVRGVPQQPGVEPTVRKNFADTAYWSASLTPNQEGIVEISLKMPENLTGWKIKTWAMGHGTKVGQGDVEVVTKKIALPDLGELNGNLAQKPAESGHAIEARLYAEDVAADPDEGIRLETVGARRLALAPARRAAHARRARA